MTETVEPAPPGTGPRLGWRIERRPRPGFAHVLGAAAGAFLVVGMVAFVAEADNEDPTMPGVVFSLILIAAALVAGFRAPGPLRSACVTAVVLAVPAMWFFGFFGGGNAGSGEIRGVYLLTLVTYVVLYVLSWTKGRAIFLAGALIFFASWVAFEVGDNSSSVVPFQSEFSTSTGSTNFGLSEQTPFEAGDDTTDATATVALVIGLVFLGVGAALDRKRYEGAATPFVAVGAFEAIVGAIVLGGNDSVLLGGLLAIGAGAVVGLVAGRGDRRRATTWIGVLVIFGGCVAVISDIAPSSAAGVGGIAFAFALVLGSIAFWLAPVLGEPDDGFEPVPPPTAPPGGDSATTTSFPDAAAA